MSGEEEYGSGLLPVDAGGVISVPPGVGSGVGLPEDGGMEGIEGVGIAGVVER